jgi:hypothetical protein
VNNSADSHHFKSFGLRKQFLQDSHLAFIYVFSMDCFWFILHLGKEQPWHGKETGHQVILSFSGFGVLEVSECRDMFVFTCNRGYDASFWLGDL